MQSYVPSLNLYVVWQPVIENKVDISLGRLVANQVYATFCRDDQNALRRSIGIQVYFGSDKTMPSTLVSHDHKADCNIVLVLIDYEMAEHPQFWADYIKELIQEDCRIIPVALRHECLNFSQSMEGLNYIRYYDFAPSIATEMSTQERNIAISQAARKDFTAWSTHEIIRNLTGNYSDNHEFVLGKATRLFLSHAKRDGEGIAKELKSKIESMPTERFFDRIHIPPGGEVLETIQDNIKQSTIVIVFTDAFSSSQWCRLEVMKAKSNFRPIILVDALNNGSPRTFPHAANVPSVRWDGTNTIDIILAALLETLRCEFAKREFKKLKELELIPQRSQVYVLPPEPATCHELVKLNPGTEVIYPDPPLTDEELEVLSNMAPMMTFYTPITGSQLPDLSLLTVAHSVTPSEDFERLGLSDEHQKDMVVELTRYLLASKACIAYGGHLGGESLTRVMLNLVQEYANLGNDPKPLKNYAAYDWSLLVTPKEIMTFIKTGVIEKIPVPTDVIAEYGLDVDRKLKEQDKALEPQEISYIYARTLTAMREKMHLDIQARIAIGGKVTGYSGRYPGIMEEIYFCLRDDKPKPVYLLGCFGGCAAKLIELIRDKTPEALTEQFQRDQSEKYNAMVDKYNAYAAAHPELQLEKIDYEHVTSTIKSKVTEMFTRKGNGLTWEENLVLFDTRDIPQAISLILKGLGTWSSDLKSSLASTT